MLSKNKQKLVLKVSCRACYFLLFEKGFRFYKIREGLACFFISKNNSFLFFIQFSLYTYLLKPFVFRVFVKFKKLKFFLV